MGDYNVTVADFAGKNRICMTDTLYQYDYGQKLQIDNIPALPQTYEAHFSNVQHGGVSITVTGMDGIVDIPNALLMTGKRIYCWIYVTEPGSGETEYQVLMPVQARPMPEYYDVTDTGAFDSVVQQVGEYAATATAGATNATASAAAAATSASEAAASASAAESAKIAAETAQGKAEDAQAAAETAAQTATQKAQQTAQDAAQAALDAGRAESAAQSAEAAQTGAESAKTDAETAAQGAADSASAASASAASAGQAATSAGQSATAAAGSATTAQGAAQTATTKASEASASATAANTAKTAAQAAQTAAETAASTATASATTATTKAAEAATSASGAAQSKTDAEAAAARAEQAAATLTVDSALSDSSTNPVQNKVINGALTDVKSAITSLPQQAIILAAYDSSDDAKRHSDFSSNSENGGIELINTAISLLPNGGRIYLRRGTYKGTVGVNINVNNITIEGECNGVTIQRASGNDIFANGTTGIVLKNITANAINLYNGAEYRLENCNIAATRVDVDTDSINGIFVPPYRGIGGINAAIYGMGDDGGTILLGEGNYTGDVSLNFYRSASPSGYKKNVRIVGCGYKTVISRDSGVNDVVANSPNIENCVLENVRIAHNVQRTGGNPMSMLRLIGCYIGGKYVDESSEGAINIVNVGAGRYFETLSAAYNMFYANSYPISETERWEIHIWGYILETTPLNIAKNRIDLIGHNALIEMRGKGEVRASFADQSTEPYGPGLEISVRDIHFKKTGCYNYYQNYAVYVSSDNVKFYNCVFENASSSPTPFDQRDYLESQEATAGARRHGIGIECKKWGSQCKTEFHDCIGIGSPYGFMNTRGWYIVFGSPKLYNCVGYGGGIGEFCHGIINHRSAQAELIGCIGYASKTAFRKSAGIRFQAAASSHLIGCVGYGSGGTKYISEGVSAARVTAICNVLGVDPSTYVVDGEVQYSSLTDAICAEISNDDITLTPLNANTEDGYGISFWANNGSAKLLNCEGYCGSGDNSHGLHCVGSATPTINGGYFGIKDMLTDIKLASNNGAYMYTALGGELNAYSKYTITNLTISITGSPTTENDVLYVQTDETPRRLIASYQLKGVASIGRMTITPRTIDAGHGILVFLKRDSTNIPIPANTYILHVQYNYAADNSSAVYIGGTANPLITNAIARAAEGCNAVEVENTVNTVRMFDCALHGDVDSGVTFATKTAVNGSSNYAI